MLLCRTALGKPFYQFSAIKVAHSPPGHHSVIGRPSAGGLSFAEYVVYRGEQVKLFQLVCHYKIASFYHVTVLVAHNTTTWHNAVTMLTILSNDGTKTLFNPVPLFFAE